MKILTLLFVFFFAVNAEAQTQKPFRCSGRIQYYPCDQKLFPDKSGVGDPTAPARRAQLRKIAANKAGLYAQVVKQSFEKTTSNRGWWRGRVKGKGQVHLQLQILRNGTVESTRYMGNVKLTDQTTWFSFKSPLPSGLGWKWNIVAFAT